MNPRTGTKDPLAITTALPPKAKRTSAFTNSIPGLIGIFTLAFLFLACTATLPFTLSSAGTDHDGRPLPARYKHGDLNGSLLPPSWAPMAPDERERAEALAFITAREAIWKQLTIEARKLDPSATISEDDVPDPTEAQIRAAAPFFLLGTDALGRDVFIRCLTGGGVSIGIGLAAALISVIIGTLYGALAGAVGGRLDALMMRIVDVLYGLPYLLLMVLLAVAGDALLSNYVSRAKDRAAFIEQRITETTPDLRTAEGEDALRERFREEASLTYPPREISEGTRALYEVGVLLIAIGGLSWLTMARVIRGQVLSLREQPFMEAARAIGVPPWRQFVRHLLPNLTGPIIVYATLTVPQAILQESFLSFLGIGVRPPLPSWGNLAAEGLVELNPIRIRWWLIVSPCILLALTLLSLNFVGEGLRETFDPKRARRA